MEYFPNRVSVGPELCHSGKLIPSLIAGAPTGQGWGGTWARTRLPFSSVKSYVCAGSSFYSFLSNWVTQQQQNSGAFLAPLSSTRTV